MKKLNLIKLTSLAVMAFFTCYPGIKAQEVSNSGFQIRLKGGIGQTMKALPREFDEVTIVNPLRQVTTTKSGLENDFLKTKWGPYGGFNLDLYLKPRFGLGLDGDIFFKNELEFIVPERIEDFLDQTNLNGLVESNRKDQSFFFIGTGPSFKLVKKNNFDIDFNLRGGLSFLQMGSLDEALPEVQSYATFAGARMRTEILHYDYSARKMALGAKAGLYLNYWFTSWFGLTAGADFIHSFVSGQRLNDSGSFTTEYKDPEYFNNDTGGFDSQAYFFINNPLDDYPAGKMNVNHLAFSAGLVFRIGVGSSWEGPGEKTGKPIVPAPALIPEDKMEVGQTFVFENIYYDFDECNFREDSKPELDRLVKLMKDNPGMEIELASHTDQRGAQDYNMRLSQCRAEAVVNYIVSKGIVKTRITPVGYGESRLLQDCSGLEGCDETGKTDCPCHKKNRRTEVKILKL